MGALMINSVKIESTLQKRIFCLKNDLIKSAPTVAKNNQFQELTPLLQF